MKLPKVRDSVLILTNVVQRYELESSVPETILDLYPGQSYQMNTTISNLETAKTGSTSQSSP